MRSRQDAKAALFEAERHGEIGGSAPARAALLRHVPHPDIVGEPVDCLLTAAVLRAPATAAGAVTAAAGAGGGLSLIHISEPTRPY